MGLHCLWSYCWSVGHYCWILCGTEQAEIIRWVACMRAPARTRIARVSYARRLEFLGTLACVKKNLQNRFDIYLKLWDTCCVEETPWQERHLWQLSSGNRQPKTKFLGSSTERSLKLTLTKQNNSVRCWQDSYAQVIHSLWITWVACACACACAIRVHKARGLGSFQEFSRVWKLFSRETDLTWENVCVILVVLGKSPNRNEMDYEIG